MKKSTAILSAIVCLLFGIIAGFMLAPVKQGVGNNSGNNNGNTTNHYYAKKEDEPESDIEQVR